MKDFLQFLLLTLIAINQCNSSTISIPACDEKDLYILWPDLSNENKFYQCFAIGKSIHLKCGLDTTIFNFDYQACLQRDELTTKNIITSTQSTINTHPSPSTPRSTAPTVGPLSTSTLPLLPSTPKNTITETTENPETTLENETTAESETTDEDGTTEETETTADDNTTEGDGTTADSVKPTEDTTGKDETPNDAETTEQNGTTQELETATNGDGTDNPETAAENETLDNFKEDRFEEEDLGSSKFREDFKAM